MFGKDNGNYDATSMMRYVKIIILVSLMAFPDFVRCHAQDMGHPRLILRKGEEAALAANLAKDATWTRLHEIVLEESERLLELPDQKYKRSVRKAMHEQCCETVRRMLFLAYSYRMTGDRRFLDKAEGVALNMCALDSWNPYHFLDVAELTVAASFAYDWLYDDLKPSTRKLLMESIRDKALTASETGGGVRYAMEVWRWLRLPFTMKKENLLTGFWSVQSGRCISRWRQNIRLTGHIRKESATGGMVRP